jgi:transporter family-2 protein
MSAADDASAPRNPVRVALATFGAFVSGVLVAVQSRANGGLAAEIGDPFLTAFISFGIGLVIVAVVALAAPSGRQGFGRLARAVRTRSIPWWYLGGGAAGAFFVVSQGLVVGLVGVALFTVGVVAGQAISSLLIDRSGMGTMPAKRPTVLRVIGAALAVVAVIIAVSGELRADAPLWILLVPLVAGLVAGWQQAVNGQLREASQSALTATLVSFVVGTAVLVVAVGIHQVVAPVDVTLPTNPVLYIGGVVGAIFIAMQVVIVRTTGVLVMGLAVLSGQVVAAALFDLLLPVSGKTIGIATLVGAGLTLVAVALASIPTRRGTTGSSGSPSR